MNPVAMIFGQSAPYMHNVLILMKLHLFTEYVSISSVCHGYKKMKFTPWWKAIRQLAWMEWADGEKLMCVSAKLRLWSDLVEFIDSCVDDLT